MAKIRRIDFSPDEWLAGTRELTPAERGVYWDVCALMYSRGGPIADDDDWLSKALAINPRTWRMLKAGLVAKGKLKIEADLITNSRSIREIQKAETRVNGARTAAEKSANERRMRAENARHSLDINDIPEAGASIYEEANYQPSTINQQPTKKTPPAAASSSSAREPVETPQAAAEGEGPRAARASRELVDEAFRRWTVTANDIGISDVGFMNSTRRELLTQRLSEIGGLDGWDLFLEKVRAAKFLLKHDGRPKFWVGLGKLLEPETFSKILEDRYAEHREVDGDRKLSGVDAIAAFAKAGAR